MFGAFFEAQAVSKVQGEPRTFTITGYYSPLPNQNFYVTGDYASEIRLNGKGLYGADGTPVYPGMMAASNRYAYLTKICVPGFGCGQVHDRGQAIVDKGERDLARHDRLDLWMGYGEEGLLRALSWGVKHLDCETFPSDSPVRVGVNFEAVMPIYQILNIPQRKFYTENLRHGMEGSSVEELQTVMAKLGYYQGVIDGIYDYDLRQAVLSFQRKHFIVAQEGDLGAGVFGPQTREKFSEEEHRHEIQVRIKEAWDAFHFDERLEKGAKNESVLKLQEILVKAEFLEAYPTGYFGPQTQAALKEFQMYHGIIDDESDYGAGKVGPNTREKLNEILKAQKAFVLDEQGEVMAYQKKYEKLKYLASRNFHVSSLLSLGDEGEPVVGLQRALKALGYIEAPPTGDYDESTRAAVRQFQLDHGVIFSEKDGGAGVFGPQTREMMRSVLRG